MKKATVPSLSNQSTVNIEGLAAYLTDRPPYLDAGLQAGSGKYALDLLAHINSFESHLRHYLMGQDITLHHVFKSIRTFQTFSDRYSLLMIGYSLAIVKETIILNEWYELMPRYEQAKQRIRRQFMIDESHEQNGFAFTTAIFLQAFP